MTLAEFSDIFALLAVQLRNTDADEATIRAYYVALKDLDRELAALAASRLAVTAEWFPKTSEWRDAALAIERSRHDHLTAVIRKRRRAALPPLCDDCDDTGWCLSPVQHRYARCACVELRRMEILGRRPLPALPAGDAPEGQPDPRVSAAIKQLAASKAM